MKKIVVIAVFFFVLLIALVILANYLQPRPSFDARAAYAAAVADAKNATPEKIARNLTSIISGNPALQWNGSRVLVTTWTSYAGYDNYTGREVNLSREVWVSVDSDFRHACSVAMQSSNSTLRMEQLMGLPPDGGKTRFVQLYADISDVFRPCPDPEITDSECGLDFPGNASSEYRAWFNEKNATSYLTNGYPWTRLGYTYDWGSPSKMGVSEFVVRKGATVYVYNVSSNQQYCGIAS